jgi:hypothetical protein
MRGHFGFGRGNREQRVRMTVALIFVAGILTFYVWFAVTHLSRG